jgi:hypothetical protein
MSYVGMKRIKKQTKNSNSRKIKLRYQTLKGKMSKTITKNMCGYLYSRDINLQSRLFVPDEMAKTS